MRFRYQLNQTVNVHVLGVLTTGVIFRREYHENSYGSSCRYRVDWNNNRTNYVELWEDTLNKIN